MSSPGPLVTREALQAFTQQLVERFAPEQIILFGSQARGEGRWDSDADILVVMPFKGRWASPSICWCAGPMRWPSATWAATRSSVKPLITEGFSMAEAWSAVPEWIRKAEADWISANFQVAP